MKIEFNSGDKLPLNKQLKFLSVTIVIRSVFEDDGIDRIEYDRIDILVGIDKNKTNVPEECDICHYWYFLDKNFNYVMI